MTRRRDQILMDIREGVRLNELHRRYYRRLKFTTTLLSLVFGSAALINIKASVPGLTAAMAVLVAACGFADLIGQWSDKAARRCEYIRGYQALLSSQLSDQELEDGLIKVFTSITDDDIESLRPVAHNDISRQWGWDHNVVPETLLQRFMRAMA